MPSGGTGGLLAKDNHLFRVNVKIRNDGSVPPLSHVRLWRDRGQIEMYQLMTRTEFLRRWSVNSPWFWNPEGQYYVCSQDPVRGVYRETVKYSMLLHALLYDPF
jgi:hypothetical protein